jgi:CBS domain-containing protein
MLVAEAMTTHPVTMTPTSSVKSAAQAMRDNDIGDVLVVDRAGDLCGIVTDRDIAMRMAAEGKKGTTRLSSVLSDNPITIAPMEPLETAEAMMRGNAVRRLPVVDERDGVIGVVSLGDLAHELDEHSCLAEISDAPPNN